MTTSLSIEICGEELVLLAERAVLWPKTASLIVADIHFGKSGHFRRHGISVPDGVDATDRERLSRLLAETGARRLVVLGDLLHAPASYGAAEIRELDDWARTVRSRADIHVVAGNHDLGAPRTALSAIHWWDDEWVDGPFRFVHDAGSPVPEKTHGLFSLSGHVHPVVRLGAGRKSRLRVPVFWQRAAGLVLPSFGTFTGGFAVNPALGETVYAAGGDSVRWLRLAADAERPG